MPTTKMWIAVVLMVCAFGIDPAPAQNTANEICKGWKAADPGFKDFFGIDNEGLGECITYVKSIISGHGKLVPAVPPTGKVTTDLCKGWLDGNEDSYKDFFGIDNRGLGECKSFLKPAFSGGNSPGSLTTSICKDWRDSDNQGYMSFFGIDNLGLGACKSYLKPFFPVGNADQSTTDICKQFRDSNEAGYVSVFGNKGLGACKALFN